MTANERPAATADPAPGPASDRAVTELSDDELVDRFEHLYHWRALPVYRECRAELKRRLRLTATERPAADVVTISLDDLETFDRTNYQNLRQWGVSHDDALRMANDWVRLRAALSAVSDTEPTGE